MEQWKKFTLKKFILIGCFVAVISSFTFYEDLFQVSKNLEIFSSVYKELAVNYVDEVNSSKMIRIGIDAMLSNLDPYTNFVQESDMENYKLQYQSAKYGGIGASVVIRDGRTIITETFDGSPASKADLRAGDEIVEINKVPVKGKDNDQTSVLLRGDKSSPIKMVINRPGVSSPIEKDLSRDEITQPNVTYYGMLPNNVGYIVLDRFLQNAAQEVKNALTDLQKNNPSGIILDLRNNGGGIVDESIQIVNLFVQKDQTVAIQRGKNRNEGRTYKTKTEPLAPDIPLVVLVNNHSASASEIVAGSLQDLDRAVIVGQRSFGKGLVQTTFNLPYGTMMKVTVAKYYTPSGRCIQALDYTHRTEAGNVDKVADSLITEYKTLKSGRSVYDGSGIYPDIFVTPVKKNLISQTLESKFYIFDYATKFRNSNPSIADAKSFRLTDAQYADFVNSLAGKDYSYDTRTEALLNDLKTEAEAEDKMGEIKSEYEALKNKVAVSKKNDLVQYKDEIRRLLENEIASRYYFQKGRIENSFKTDEDMAAALKVIGNKNTFASILKGDGAYKTIGKPSAKFTSKK